ncbi:pilus assembly protein [Pseudolabrys taiwanensis]|uniref:Pilus assembly protein n=2 Tax=Pseudolabrys taiwanensis TaxID=331696 RepID=A0A346A176_9HYPH|nr:pilus assembly protein [Pseudolabrys taiwanensis]
MRIGHRRPWFRAQRGAAAIEYGLILPMLLLFIIGIIDVSRLLWNYTTLNRAVEAAARCGAINTIDCGTTAQIQARAVAEAWGMNVATSAFTVTTSACGVQVVGTYDFVFAIPALVGATPLGTLTLSATSCYPINPVGG